MRGPLLDASVVFVALTNVLGLQARLIGDDVYLQAAGWLQANVPPATPVALTSDRRVRLAPRLTGLGALPSLTSPAADNAQYAPDPGRPVVPGLRQLSAGAAGPAAERMLNSSSTTTGRRRGTW